MFFNCTKLQEGNLAGGGINLSGWDVNNVTTMKEMFNRASAFDGKMFTVSNTTTDLTAMFMQAVAFNNSNTFSIESWDTSGVTATRSMFFGANAFNRDISTWNTSSVTNMKLMFGNYNNNLNIFNQPIGTWDTSAVTNMSGILYRNNAFDQDISTWNVNNLSIANSTGFIPLDRKSVV